MSQKLSSELRKEANLSILFKKMDQFRVYEFRLLQLTETGFSLFED
jgi:hypothetical protein